MPFQFALTASGFRIGKLDAVLSRWADSAKLDLARNVTLDRVDGSATVFAPGRSLRGFRIAQRGGRLRTRLALQIDDCASRGDWQLLFSLLGFLLEQGARGTEEDGLPLSAGGLTNEEASRRARFYFKRDLRALQSRVREQRGAPVALATPRGSLSLGASDIGWGSETDAELDAIEARLVTLAARLP